MKSTVSFQNKLPKSLFLSFLFLVGVTNISFSQAEISLWYIPTTKHISNSQHHHAGNEFLIPCGWNYYHRYDGESHVIEYGIRNEGDAPLTLNLPLTFDNGSSIEFVVMEQPSKAVLQPGDDIHFKVQYLTLGAYQPAKATLKIPNNAPNSSDCMLKFRVGGPQFSLPFAPSLCLKEMVSNIDFDADNTIEQVSTSTRTLDERNNIIEIEEVSEDGMGNEFGRFTTISTYTASNDLLTEKLTASGGFGGFLNSSMITNTYNVNNQLIKMVVVQEVFFGTNIVTNEHTYDSNNQRILTKRLAEPPFGPAEMFDIAYTYDANNNLLTETTTNSGTSIVTC